MQPEPLHTSPVPQLAPLATFVQAEVLDPGWQLWQELAGLGAPAAITRPPMKQPETQLVPLQTSPVPHDAPSARPDHPVVLPAGWQVWHALAGSGVPAAYTVPPMKHPAPQLPVLHTVPVPQAVPFASFVHAVALTAGWQL
jgi:hypothetical protein